MFNKFSKLLILILILLFSKQSYADQKNKNSIFIGISPFWGDLWFPFCMTQVSSKDPSNYNTTSWVASGCFIEVLHSPSFFALHLHDKEIASISFNHSIGVLNWNRQQIDYTQKKWSTGKTDKGYSYVYIPSMRYGSSVDSVLGGYIFAGLSFIDNRPKNVASYENANHTQNYGYNYGIGLFSNIGSIIFSTDIYLQGKYFNNSKFQELDILKFSIYYNVF